MENTPKLAEIIRNLSPAKQELVEKFAQKLAEEDSPAPTFEEALDSFVREHAELLRLLAK